MVQAIVKIKRATGIEIHDDIGLTTSRIQESYEEMYCNDDEVVCIDVVVIA